MCLFSGRAFTMWTSKQCLFLHCWHEVAEQSPDISYEAVINDNCCMMVAKNLAMFDGLLMPSLLAISSAIYVQVLLEADTKQRHWREWKLTFIDRSCAWNSSSHCWQEHGQSGYTYCWALSWCSSMSDWMSRTLDGPQICSQNCRWEVVHCHHHCLHKGKLIYNRWNICWVTQLVLRGSFTSKSFNFLSAATQE